ncbi:hypothetical protein [Thioclava sp.]|uniref:hypothetical protein n=1 Tax=Thioclava sp. TaxID=1933450 RepID=UPI003AA7F1FB
MAPQAVEEESFDVNIPGSDFGVAFSLQGLLAQSSVKRIAVIGEQTAYRGIRPSQSQHATLRVGPISAQLRTDRAPVSYLDDAACINLFTVFS